MAPFSLCGQRKRKPIAHTPDHNKSLAAQRKLAFQQHPRFRAWSYPLTICFSYCRRRFEAFLEAWSLWAVILGV